MLENKSLLLVETTVDRVAVDKQLKKNEILQTIFTYHSDIRKGFRKGARGVTEFVPPDRSFPPCISFFGNSQTCDPAQMVGGYYYLLVAREDVGVGVAVAIEAVAIIIGVIVEVSAGTRTTCSLPLLSCFAKLSSEE